MIEFSRFKPQHLEAICKYLSRKIIYKLIFNEISLFLYVEACLCLPPSVSLSLSLSLSIYIYIYIYIY